MDADAVWALHLRNKEQLSTYAKAMHQLATCFWTPPPHINSCNSEKSATVQIESRRACRYRWAAREVRNYYTNGGRRTILRHKDAKRLARYRTLRPDLVSEEAVAAAEGLAQGVDNLAVAAEHCGIFDDNIFDGDMKMPLSSSESDAGMDESRLKVLDVGSCFNPLQNVRYGSLRGIVNYFDLVILLS